MPFCSVESDHQRVGGDRGRAQIEKLGTTFRSRSARRSYVACQQVILRR